MKFDCKNYDDWEIIEDNSQVHNRMGSLSIINVPSLYQMVLNLFSIVK